MNDEQLELLLTLDYPWYAPDEDLFHPVQADNDVTYWPPSQPFPAAPISV